MCKCFENDNSYYFTCSGKTCCNFVFTVVVEANITLLKVIEKMTRQLKPKASRTNWPFETFKDSRSLYFQYFGLLHDRMSHFMYLHFQINFDEVEKGGCAAVSQATLMPSVLIFLRFDQPCPVFRVFAIFLMLYFTVSNSYFSTIL